MNQEIVRGTSVSNNSTMAIDLQVWDRHLASKTNVNRTTNIECKVLKKCALFYSYFKKGCRKNVHATIPRVIWDIISTLFSRANLLNFFEEHLTQNHPQYLSGLSHAIFPTTFLEIAVYTSLKSDHRTDF